MELKGLALGDPADPGGPCWTNVWQSGHLVFTWCHRCKGDHIGSSKCNRWGLRRCIWKSVSPGRTAGVAGVCERGGTGTGVTTSVVSGKVNQTIPTRLTQTTRFPLTFPYQLWQATVVGSSFEGSYNGNLSMDILKDNPTNVISFGSIEHQSTHMQIKSTSVLN